ncbi:MAG: flavin reductase family protein [Hadesarchaea archaeon]|nr:MAG: flavin reductase family protein [Hadesarchaea archaeon]
MKEVPKELVYRLLHPRQVILVTCVDEKGKPNLLTVAWSTPLSFDPPLVGISIGKNRYSHDLLSRTKEFAISIPPSSLLERVKACGRLSGRKCEKFKEVGLTPQPSRCLRVPVVKEGIAHLECKVVKEVEVGDHTLFVGEVVKAYADERFFDGEKFDPEKVGLIYHLGGTHFLFLGKG